MTSSATKDANFNSSGSIVAAGTVFTDDYFDEYGVPKPRLFARSRESDGKTEYKVFPIRYKVGQTHPLVHDAESENLRNLTSYLGADVPGYKLVTAESTLNPEEGALILSAFKAHAEEVCEATSYLERRHLRLLKTSDQPGGTQSLTNNALSIHACDNYAASIPSVVANFMYSVREHRLEDSPHKSSLTRAPGKIYAELATNFLRLDEELAERAGNSCLDERCQGETTHLRDALHDSTNADLTLDDAGKCSDSMRLWQVLENREEYLESQWTARGLEKTLERLQSGRERPPLVSLNSTTRSVVNNTARWLEGAFRSFGQPHHRLSQGLGLDTENVPYALGGSHKPSGSSHSESGSAICAPPAALQSLPPAKSLVGRVTRPGAKPSPLSSSTPSTVQVHDSVTHPPVSSAGFVLQDTSDEKPAPVSSTVVSKESEQPQHGSSGTAGVSVRNLLTMAGQSNAKPRRRINYDPPTPGKVDCSPTNSLAHLTESSTIGTKKPHPKTGSGKKRNAGKWAHESGDGATTAGTRPFTAQATSRVAARPQVVVPNRPLPSLDLPSHPASGTHSGDSQILSLADSRQRWEHFRSGGSQQPETRGELSEPPVAGSLSASRHTGSKGNSPWLDPNAIPYNNRTTQVGSSQAESYDDPHSASDATHPESLKMLPPHLAQTRNSWDGTLLGTHPGVDGSDVNDSDASDTSRPPSV